MRLIAGALLTATILTAFALPAAAQAVDPFDAVAAAVLQMLRDQSVRQAAVVLTGPTDALAATVDQLPRTGPLAKQLTAPSVAGGATITDAASFPELFGLALGSNLVSAGQGALTLDLNLFGPDVVRSERARSTDALRIAPEFTDQAVRRSRDLRRSW